MSKDPLELLASDPVELTILTLKTRLMMIVTKLIQDAGYNQVEAASVLRSPNQG